MKKNQPKQPQNSPSDPEDKPDRSSQDKLSQDVLSDEQLDEVSGGTAGQVTEPATGHATGRRIQQPIEVTTPVGQASPILSE